MSDAMMRESYFTHEHTQWRAAGGTYPKAFLLVPIPAPVWFSAEWSQATRRRRRQAAGV